MTAGNNFHDFVGSGRLSDEVVHAHSLAGVPVVLSCICRERGDERGMRDSFGIKDTNRGSKTVHDRHLKIHKDNIVCDSFKGF